MRGLFYSDNQQYTNATKDLLKFGLSMPNNSHFGWLIISF